MKTYTHELIGGHPALDFLNTVSDWKAAEKMDRLESFDDVLGFAVAAGLLRCGEARALEGRGSAAELTQLRELRERLARVFMAVLASAPPAAADLDRLARDAARASSAVSLKRAGGRLVRTIVVDGAGAQVIRWRLVDAALALLTSEQVAAVKSCPSCGWFFLDMSKNGSRRWCSMQMCGATIKARRYYYRKRGS